MKAATLAKLQKTAYWRDYRNMVKDIAGILSENGLSITKYAEAASLSPTTVSKVIHGETGLPQLLTLWKMSVPAGYTIAPVERAGKKPSTFVDIWPKRRKKQRGKRRKKS